MQAEYAKLLEQAKHNRATEVLGAGELEVKRRQQIESERANKAREYLTAAELDEKIRHDLTSEAEMMREFDISQSEIERYHRAQEGQWRAENELKMAIAEMQDSRERYLAAVNNDNRTEIAKLQAETQSRIARADRSARKNVEDARNTIEMFKANTQDAKAKAEIAKLEAQVNQMGQELMLETRRVEAYENQADAAVQQAQTAADRLEEDRYMNDWQIQLDRANYSLAQTQQKIEGVKVAVDSATKIFNSAVGLASAKSGASGALQKGKWKWTG
jgi:transcriptional regulator